MKRAAVLILFLLLPLRAWGAITETGTAATTGGQDQTTVSVAHDSGATGSNCVTIAGVVWRDTTNTITSITYDAAAMTLVTSGYFNGGSNVNTAIYYLLNSAHRGSHTFSVSISAIANIVAGVQTFCGVDQATPFGTVATFGDAAGHTSASVNVSSAAGELVIDVLGKSDFDAATVGASQTQVLQATTGSTDAADRTVGMSKEAGAGTVTMSWTWTNSDVVAQVAVPLKPATATSRPVPPIIFQ